MVVMVVVLISKKSDKATVKESDDTQKNTDAIANEIKHKEWYLSDFAKAVFFDDSKSSDIEKKSGQSFFTSVSRPMATMRILTFSNGLRKTILGFLIGQINILHRHAYPRRSDDFDAEDPVGGNLWKQ